MSKEVIVERGMLESDPTLPVRAAPLRFESDFKPQHQQTVNIPYASHMRCGICDCGNLVGIDLLDNQKRVIGHGHFDIEGAKVFRNIFDAAIQQLDKELAKHGKLIDNVMGQGIEAYEFKATDFVERKPDGV